MKRRTQAPGRLLFRRTAMLGLAALFAARALGEPATIRRDTVVREVVRLAQGRKPADPVRRRFDVVVMENRYLQVIVCPELGERILNVIDKTTGRTCLYEGLIRYSGSAYTEGGGSGGGLQINHPLYHAGSSYVAPLPYAAEVTPEGAAVVTLAYSSYPHRQNTVWKIRLRADEAALRCSYRFENLAPFSMGFNPWIDASFPMRDDARFILPADRIAGHWFGINPAGGDGDWGHHLRPWPIGDDGKDQSYARNRKWSAAFAYGLTGGYSGIYFEEADAGFAHVFDPDAMPGAKAAGAWSSNGWMEVWGAFTHNMEDPRWLGPHETVEASDLWFPLHGIGGMTWANGQGALNLRREGNRLRCGVYLLRDHGRGALRVTADGSTLQQTALALRPESPYDAIIDCPAATDEVRVTVTDEAGRRLIEKQYFFSDRPRRALELPAEPWHRKTLVTQARWQEAFTPLMGWGPWYHPPTTYRKALEQEPNNREASLGLARSLIKEAAANLFRGRRDDTSPAQQYAEARTLLETLLKAPDPRAARLLALVQLETGDEEGAATTLGRLAGSPDDTALIHYQLALLAARGTQWTNVADEARFALRLGPDGTLPRLLLAIALLESGMDRDADAELEAILRSNPVDISALLLLRRARPPDAGRITAQLERLARLAPLQYRAAVAAIASLRQGRDPDPYAADTTTGPDELPGRNP